MKKYFFFAAVALMAASCINDENDNSVADQQNGEVISLTASMASETTRAKAADKLQDTQFESDKSIHVDIYEKDATAPYTSGNYTTGTSGAMTGTLYYPASQKHIDIEAYYPSSITYESTSFTVGTAQTSEANYQSYDLMYATRLTDQEKKTSGTHDLTFNHALAKIIVNIVAGSGVSDANITSNVTAVKINNTITTATITKGVVTPPTTGTKSDINIFGTGASNIGVIIPQEVAAGTFITVTYNGNDYTYALPSAKTFVAANSYTYTLTLNAASISLKSEQINPWTADTGDTKDIIL